MKQCKLAQSLFVSVLLFSSTAFAHTSLKGEIMPVAAYNWTGLYLGGNVGAVNHTMNITDNQAVAFDATVEQVSNPRVTGGFQLGYRWQADPAVVSGVYGAEFSAEFSDANFRRQYGSPFALYQLNSENKLKDVCMFQLTGGIAANRTLVFLAAGLSWSRVTGKTSNLDGIPFNDGFSVTKSELGTALGGGIEYAFTDNFSARVKVDVITPNTYTTWDNLDDKFTIANNIVEGSLGVNYKLPWLM